MATSCARCGADPGGTSQDALPLDWSVHVEGDHRLTLCATCTREHLRSIEAKLDSEWW